MEELGTYRPEVCHLRVEITHDIDAYVYFLEDDDHISTTVRTLHPHIRRYQAEAFSKFCDPHLNAYAPSSLPTNLSWGNGELTTQLCTEDNRRVLLAVVGVVSAACFQDGDGDPLPLVHLELEPLERSHGRMVDRLLVTNSSSADADRQITRVSASRAMKTFDSRGFQVRPSLNFHL